MGTMKKMNYGTEAAMGSALTGSAIVQAAKSSGTSGALLGGGVALVSSGWKYLNDEIDEEECATSIVRAAVTSGLSGASSVTAASMAAAGATTALAATAAPVWVPAVVGIGAATLVGTAITSLVNEVFDWF